MNVSILIGISESNLSHGTGKITSNAIHSPKTKFVFLHPLKRQDPIDLFTRDNRMNNQTLPEYTQLQKFKRGIIKVMALIVILTGTASGIYSQIDTLVLVNGDIMVGELKNMKNAVVQVETDYSDSDFKIEWDKVAQIYTSTYYLVNLKDGSRLNGIVRTSHTDSSVVLITDRTTITRTTVIDILYMQSVKKNIWSRFDVLLEVGFNFTKANNLRQYNSRTAFGYTANTWSAQATYNGVSSGQDSVATTKRTDASLSLNWFLQNNWYVLAASSFLQNDEQKLQLRATPKLGMGNYLIRNNHWLLEASGGLAMNIETFQNDDPDRSSLEGFVGAGVNIFNVSDFSMNTRATVYPSITKGGRVRTDINFDLKYDLFGSDFYIKFGVTYNYDNRPAMNASTSDYVFQTTFGWEL